MKKSTHSSTMQQAFVFKMIVFFTCLFSCHLFAQTNPYQSDVVSWNSMQTLNGPVKAIAARGFYTVALKEDGTLVTWGYIGGNQSTIPAGLANVKAIAAGGHHTVALKEDGTVVAWGRNDDGESTIPEDLTNVKVIAAGRNHTVALINRSASVIEQPKSATNKNRSNLLLGSCLFVPQNSVATLYDTQGRMLAKWNTGWYDLHQRTPANGSFIIRVKGDTKFVLKYVNIK